jgi:hypothetical protein
MNSSARKKTFNVTNDQSCVGEVTITCGRAKQYARLVPRPPLNVSFVTTEAKEFAWVTLLIVWTTQHRATVDDETLLLVRS